ncbi:MAG TPA: glycosyltransferase family 4 protein [Reyranella sp.]|nr:glycosyltransferase family 4 protein [Reyranella sp.]
MRFLFFVGGWQFGGMETAYLSLMKGLKARGHEPTAIVCGWTDGIVPELLERAGIAWHEVRLGRLYLRNPYWTWHTLWRMPMARRRLRLIGERLRPDWVVYPEPQMVLLTASLVAARRAMYLQSPPGRLIEQGWSRRALEARLDRIVCVSDFIARGLPVARGKTAVVHNGVDLRPPVLREQAPVRIGIVGRVAEEKQHLVLLESCAILRARLPAGRFAVDIVGENSGAFARQVEQRIRDRGLGEVVHWAGFVADRDALYGNLDIVAAPAIDEPFGLTVPEAGAYGLPVVAARSGAFPEIVQDGVTGLMFDAGDVGGLARALEQLILDRALRRRLGAAAHAHVARHFTVERMAGAFLSALG